MTEVETQLIVSPCIRMCCLDDQEVCLGCFRSLDEIRNWQASDNAIRAQVLQHCELRRKAHDEKFPGLSSLRA
jgi:uncharacterized protein